MALANYDELKTAVQDWIGDRSDVGPNMENFCALLAANLNAMPDFRIMEMETFDNLSISATGSATLLANYLEWRRVYSPSTSPVRVLQYLTPDRASELYPYGTDGSGIGKHFTIIGNDNATIYIYPQQEDGNEDWRVDYYRMVSALSAANNVEPLLTKFPNLFLYGTLMYAATYLQDRELIETYGSLYQDAVHKIIAQDRGTRYARAAVRQPGLTP